MNAKFLTAACLAGAIGLAGCQSSDPTLRGAGRGAGFGAAGGAVVGAATADNRRYYRDRRGREYYMDRGRRIYR